jgi:hypothetical protein
LTLESSNHSKESALITTKGKTIVLFW